MCRFVFPFGPSHICVFVFHYCRKELKLRAFIPVSFVGALAYS